MLGANKSTGLALTVALLLSQTIAFADESSSTSIKTNTPLGSSSTSVNTNSDASGSSKSVQKSEVGLGGAKMTSKQEAVRANADGSVTAAQSKEAHVYNGAGSAHTRSSASTTVSPDGSNTTVKEQHASVNP